MQDPSGNFASWFGTDLEMSDATLGNLETALAENVTFTLNGAAVGTGRAAVMAAIRGAVAAGWTHHNTLSVSVNGDFMASTYRNDYSDGTSSIGCAIARFNTEHRAVEIHTMAEQARLLDGR
ncbi:MAG: hypothetical protein AB7W59_26760 [Acidimicrobiia bacterium]